MKARPFRAHLPATVVEAVELLGELGDDAKVLAGGQSLVPMLALRLTSFEHLVDLNRVDELVGIEPRDGAVRVGAMTRQTDAEHDWLVRDRVPLLARSLPLVGHFQIRNRGTIGGSVAHADPAAEVPAVALALDAVLEITSPSGSRREAASNFFRAAMTTSLDTRDVLVGVEFPVWEPRSGFAIEEVVRRHGDFCLAGAACGVTCDPDGTIVRASIALFGVSGTPVRASESEAALVGAARNVVLADVASVATASLDPTDDLHASARYRRRAVPVVVERALRRALDEACDA